MEAFGVPTPKMDWDSTNLPDGWRRFRQHVELMFTGPLKAKSEEEKCSFLLLWIGVKGRDISNTWTLTADESKTLKTYYDRFTEYLTPKANPIFARYKFHEKTQGSSESFEHFVTELKLLVKDCGYTNSDEMVRDRIVFATNSPRVREKLLSNGPELTLEKAIDIARSHELSQAQLKAMANECQVHHKIVKPGARRGASNKPKDHQKNQERACSTCGGNHSYTTECPAKGKQCMKCKKFNHYARVCKTKPQTQNRVRYKNVHTVEEVDEDYDSELYVDTITAEEEDEESAYADIGLGPQNRQLKFKLDTGAQASIIPATAFATLMPKTQLKAPDHRLTGYGGHSLEVKGYCNIEGRYKERSTIQKFYVVNCNGPPILGFRACKALGLIKVVYAVSSEKERTTQSDKILSEYADVFKGIGTFPGECSFTIDPEVAPVVCPPRRVPFALKDRLKTELDNMEREGIICKVTEPTQWVNALVVCEKPKTGKLRICLDPRPLNKAIMRPHYPLPTLEDVTSKLAGAKFFSILDARSGYWAIKLSEESSLLTTFNTTFGRYRFLRLPFGIVSAQDEFQRRVDETYEGLRGVAGIVDDIVVFGKTKEEHDRNLRAMLSRTRERGMRLNPEKCCICVPEVSYIGPDSRRPKTRPT